MFLEIIGWTVESDDEDFIPIYNVPEKNLTKEVDLTPSEMPSDEERYGATHMTSFLLLAFNGNGSYEPKGLAINRPSVYPTQNAFVFAPSSDNVNSQLESLQNILEINVEILNGENSQYKALLKSRLWLFPITEEGGILGSAFLPRNHWVTLCYNPNTEKATLLDSRPWIFGWHYSLQSMSNMLRTGLKPYRLNLREEITATYQATQYDDIHCGRWTAINLMLLAQQGLSDELATHLSANDRDDMLAYLTNLAQGNKLAPYVPLALRNLKDVLNHPHLKDPNSSNLDEMIDSFFSKGLEEAKQTVTSNFLTFISNEELIISAIFASQGKQNQEIPLTKADDTHKLATIITYLENHDAEIRKKSLQDEANENLPSGCVTQYSPKFYTWLNCIGIQNKTIDTWRFPEIVSLNAALFYTCTQYFEKFETLKQTFDRLHPNLLSLLKEEKINSFFQTQVEPLLSSILRQAVELVLQSLSLDLYQLRPLIGPISNKSGGPSTMLNMLYAFKKLNLSSNNNEPKIPVIYDVRSTDKPIKLPGVPVIKHYQNTNSLLPHQKASGLNNRKINDALRNVSREFEVQISNIEQIKSNNNPLFMLNNGLFSTHNSLNTSSRTNSQNSNGEEIQNNEEEDDDINDEYVMNSDISSSTRHNSLNTPSRTNSRNSNEEEIQNSEEEDEDDDNNRDNQNHLLPTSTAENIHLGRNTSNTHNPIATTTHTPSPTPPQNHHFQLRCLQALLALSLALAVLTILTCPPVAASIGATMGVGLATGILASSASLSGICLGSSLYGFYALHKKSASTGQNSPHMELS